MSRAGGSPHLPDLGPRGEGWVALQALLFVVVIGSGFLGPLWSDAPRMIGAVAGVVLIVLGGGLTVAGILGLRRQLTAFPRPVTDGRLIDGGAFGLVRHPMYGGGVIAGLGWGLAMASPATLASALVLLVFFDLKSRREEAWLEDEFAEYPAYRRRTRRLIPWLY
ncbi:MAG: methyltransferase family protein [Candidatus Limnocylindrales bacterium]